eukprot:GHVH01012130.1.p1 GENE.GHVH01012130.1~~GHVH01012130.1.p1  ORF type:complete len:328 (+),score=34.72 GHVH01012130.1:58-1041(+)
MQANERRAALEAKVANGRSIQRSIGVTSPKTRLLQAEIDSNNGATQLGIDHQASIEAARWVAMPEIVSLRREIHDRTAEVRRLESEANCSQFCVNSTLGKRLFAIFKESHTENAYYGHLLENPDILPEALGLNTLRAKYEMMVEESKTLLQQIKMLKEDNESMKTVTADFPQRSIELKNELDILNKQMSSIIFKEPKQSAKSSHDRVYSSRDGPRTSQRNRSPSSRESRSRSGYSNSRYHESSRRRDDRSLDRRGADVGESNTARRVSDSKEFERPVKVECNDQQHGDTTSRIAQDAIRGAIGSAVKNKDRRSDSFQNVTSRKRTPW